MAALTVVFLFGIGLGALVNWATYSLAWNRRDISPWSAPASGAPPRVWTDRLPIWGWVGLRRETFLHGPRFWLRPMVVELAMGVGLAALYDWEVAERGLLVGQVAGIWKQPLPLANWNVPSGWVLGEFFGHVVLIVFMAAATLIDIDEKIIPDEITVPGTLLGLLLAPLLSMPLLPHLDLNQQIPLGGQVVEIQPSEIRPQEGWQLTLESVGLAIPNSWPEKLHGAPALGSLGLGLGCFGFWCFALTPRYWRGRRNLIRGLKVLTRRVMRELLRPPLAWIVLLGMLYVTGCWWLGGEVWQGLLSALVGLVVSGSIVWAVRLVGTAALHREAMGFGDVTLMMMIGTYVGWQAGLMIFFVAPFAGLIIGVGQMVLRRGDVIPYGPFLCLGTLAVIVRWGTVWDRETLQPIFSMGWLVLMVLVVGMLLLGMMLAIWRVIKMKLFGVAEDNAP